jgi:hypothetical protein
MHALRIFTIARPRYNGRLTQGLKMETNRCVKTGQAVPATLAVLESNVDCKLVFAGMEGVQLAVEIAVAGLGKAL